MEKILKLSLYIRSNNAKVGPPLGTTLGNLGVNTLKFCKEFNEYTKDLPDYFLLKVNIEIAENKSFTFTVEPPSLGFLIYLLKKEESTKDIHGRIISIKYILLEDFLQIIKFKYVGYLNYDFKKAIKIVKGSLYSSNIIIKI